MLEVAEGRQRATAVGVHARPHAAVAVHGRPLPAQRRFLLEDRRLESVRLQPARGGEPAGPRSDHRDAARHFGTVARRHDARAVIDCDTPALCNTERPSRLPGVASWSPVAGAISNRATQLQPRRRPCRRPRGPRRTVVARRRADQLAQWDGAALTAQRALVRNNVVIDVLTDSPVANDPAAVNIAAQIAAEVPSKYAERRRAGRAIIC